MRRPDAPAAIALATTHLGRSWVGNKLEADCPCGKAPCGLVDSARIDPACPQHALGAAKTMRQAHNADECPAPHEPDEMGHPLRRRDDLAAEVALHALASADVVRRVRRNPPQGRSGQLGVDGSRSAAGRVGVVARVRARRARRVRGLAVRMKAADGHGTTLPGATT